MTSKRDVGTILYGADDQTPPRRSREELVLEVGNKVNSGAMVTAGATAGSVKAWAVGDPWGGIVMWDTDATDAAKRVAVVVRECTVLRQGALAIALEDNPAATIANIDAWIATFPTDVLVRESIDPQ
ncbi:MAG: hypothetical protein ACR2RB_16020 [Gammaproteobacteria bacterium]